MIGRLFESYMEKIRELLSNFLIFCFKFMVCFHVSMYFKFTLFSRGISSYLMANRITFRIVFSFDMANGLDYTIILPRDNVHSQTCC